MAKEGMKTWILLNEDLKTPHLVDVGGASQFDSNHVMYVIVQANSREEAKKFMKWGYASIRSKTIIDPMVVEITDLRYNPARIEYDY